MAINENQRRKEILQDLEQSLDMYRAAGEGTDEHEQAFARGQAMSHVLFHINQQFGKRVGGLSILFGNKIQKLQEEFGIEVVPFAYLPEDEAKQAFVEYVLFSRFADESRPDTSLLESAVQKGLEANPRKSTVLDAGREYKFSWSRFVR